MIDRRVGLAAPLVAACVAACVAAPLSAQGEDYDFAEREPATVLEALIDAKLPSLVKVHGASGLRSIDPFAAGVIVSEQGHVLTLDLVMIQPGQTRIVLADGSVHEAELLPPEPKLGVRLLKFDPAGVAMPLVAQQPAKHLPEPATLVVTIGNAFRLAEFSEKLSASFGIVNATATTGLRHRLADLPYEGRLILTDAPNNPGHFGGGMFTLDGAFVGINARVAESTETNTLLSAAVPCADLQPYLDRWLHGRVPDAGTSTAATVPGEHGIRLFDEGGRRSPPAYVERVRRGSPAAALGLRADDLIVRVGDVSVRSCAEFRAAMAPHGPGAEVELTWKRGDDVLRGTMTLGEAR